MTSERGHFPTCGPVWTQTQMWLPRRSRFLPASAATSGAKTRARDPGFPVCREHVQASYRSTWACWRLQGPQPILPEWGGRRGTHQHPAVPTLSCSVGGCHCPAPQGCHSRGKEGPETRESPQARKPRCRQLEARPKGPEGGKARGHLASHGSICSHPEERLPAIVLVFLVVSLIFEHLLYTELQAGFEGPK